jgi:hypothetical protein
MEELGEDRDADELIGVTVSDLRTKIEAVIMYQEISADLQAAGRLFMNIKWEELEIAG